MPNKGRQANLLPEQNPSVSALDLIRKLCVAKELNKSWKTNSCLAPGVQTILSRDQLQPLVLADSGQASECFRRHAYAPGDARLLDMQ
jgi:hypothetical protein